MGEVEALQIPTEVYPPFLDDWKARSRALWFRGNLDLLRRPMISIVGARLVSPEGKHRAQRSTRVSVQEGWVVVSGLAAGVDTIAHETALECGGDTIAVLGTPIERCYPKENEALKETIERRGLVLSQFPPGTGTRRWSFPARNTLMAALSRLTLVIEAGEMSGTRYQVGDAVRMGRLVGLLRSLVDARYHWIEEAMSSGRGRVINDENDLRSVLREALKLSPPRVQEPTQEELF